MSFRVMDLRNFLISRLRSSSLVLAAALLLCDPDSTPPLKAEGLNWLFSGFDRPIDRGGRISDYQARVQSAHGPHVISGDCMSACTLWLQYKNTCVERNATLWFHAATFGQDYFTTLRGPWRAISTEASSRALERYPAKLRAFIKEKGWLERPDYNRLSGEELAQFGVSLCGEANVPGPISALFFTPAPFSPPAAHPGSLVISPAARRS